MPTYSFMDVSATIAGPGGSFALGYGAGVAEEGITINRTQDKNTLTTGADGTPMNSLHAAKPGEIIIRLQKTSPTNALLMAMYDLQSLSSANWGQNVIVVSNTATGDTTTARFCAFKRAPNLVYATEGGMNEWTMDAGLVDSILGIAA